MTKITITGSAVNTLAVPCPACWAAIGQPCHTISIIGNDQWQAVREPHQSRIEAAKAANKGQRMKTIILLLLLPALAMAQDLTLMPGISGVQKLSTDTLAVYGDSAVVVVITESQLLILPSYPPQSRYNVERDTLVVKRRESPDREKVIADWLRRNGREIWRNSYNRKDWLKEQTPSYQKNREKK